MRKWSARVQSVESAIVLRRKLEEGALRAAPAILVLAHELAEGLLVGSVLDRASGHDRRVFSVIGVVALSEATLHETVLPVEVLGGIIGYADLQRDHDRQLRDRLLDSPD